MARTPREITDTGRAARALSRSGLFVVRVPDDLEPLIRLGMPAGTTSVHSLVQLGLLRPVARGLYEVRRPDGVSLSSFEQLLVARLSGTPHLVTGWWALAHAGLTNQDVRELVVLTGTKRRDFHALGRHAHLVKVSLDDLWGGTELDSGLNIATPERSLCDAAGRPSSRIPATRLTEALEAFLNSDRRAEKRLLEALRRYGSPTAARRLGYLLELIVGADDAEPFHTLIGTSHRADALDPGDESAPIISRWQVRTHLTPDELLEHRRVS